MANNISSIMFSSLMFAFLLLPMISGQMVPCLPGPCTSATPCDAKCKSKGYKGGACVFINIGAKTGACCCKVNFESQVSSISDNTNVSIKS
ncbi:unnamed protein product [Cochlearia groenlandica]